jgi:THO complex subunit 5
MEDGEIEEGSIPMAEEEQQQQQQSFHPHSSEDNQSEEESPYETLHNSKSSIESIISDILSIKREAKPKQLLRDLVTQMFLHFITLRQVPRVLHNFTIQQFVHLKSHFQ